MRVIFFLAIIITDDVTCLVPCGRLINRSGKIVGGELAQDGDFLWQVQLRKYGTQVCGGSILSENFVVTAAHCVQNNPSIYTIGFGSLKKYNDVKIVPVKSVHIHPNWQPNRGLSNDIALLRLAKPVSFSQLAAAPVCLPPNGYVPQGNLKVSGWGRTKEGGTTSQELRFTVVPIIHDDQCSSRYGPIFNRTSMFCAMYPIGGRDSCQGDSGGPAVVNHKGMHYLSGVVSWGEGCARYGAPGVYTRVSQFTPWIEQILSEEGSPSDLEQIQLTLNEVPLARIEAQSQRLLLDNHNP